VIGSAISLGEVKKKTKDVYPKEVLDKGMLSLAIW